MNSMKRALLSVSDKTGIVEFAQGLARRGWALVSTGGTARTLREAGLDVTEVAEITGHPEMMEGRVKTLHPAVHAGLLARREREDDLAALEAQGYGPIDLVAVNLYPFRETIAPGNVTVDAAMEKVDIGGPTMIRAAAKNHRDVWVVVDPADYAAVLEALDGAGGQGEEGLRRRLAAKVFRHISGYDAAIAAYLEGEPAADSRAGSSAEDMSGSETFPEEAALSLTRIQTLRYGENPDQEAAFYRVGTAAGVAALTQHHGKELSYNNILDLDGALLSLSPFAFSPRPAVCIVKHTTPAGLAVGESLVEAYEKALRCDPVSAFGSVIAVNRPVDAATAEAMAKLFVECIVAPGFTDAALERLTRKKNLRLLTFPGLSQELEEEPAESWWREAGEEERGTARFLAAHGRLPQPRAFRSVYGGMLAQTPGRPPFYGRRDGTWKVATTRAPDEREWDDLCFAWAAVYGVKSNAILLAGRGATLGIGAGQMSRVDSSRIAVRKAGDQELDLQGAVLASDAFFPFRDGVDAAAEAGVRAIVQPGGSIRDEEVIQAADEHGLAMVFTGRRLFRH
ncbi:MAG: bifunctional phosphoribosylaminoimidazolecarboxamide formyltransferase/IMP cyclohydrolase [Gemmatimonadota bacterium]